MNPFDASSINTSATCTLIALNVWRMVNHVTAKGSCCNTPVSSLTRLELTRIRQCEKMCGNRLQAQQSLLLKALW